MLQLPQLNNPIPTTPTTRQKKNNVSYLRCMMQIKPQDLQLDLDWPSIKVLWPFGVMFIPLHSIQVFMIYQTNKLLSLNMEFQSFYKTTMLNSIIGQ